jgi:hypothetical protein
MSASGIREVESGVHHRRRSVHLRARRRGPKAKPALNTGPHRRDRRSAAPVSSLAGDWANQIAILAANRKTSVIELGRVVHAARQSLGYGEWAKLWRSERIPFRKRQGDKLRRIGEVLGPLDAHVCAQLPCGSSSLYHLARLDCAAVQQLVQEGVIHPRLKPREVIALVAKRLGSPESETHQLNLKQRLHRLQQFVHETLPGWTSAHRRLAVESLSELIGLIRATFASHAVVANTASPLPLKSNPHGFPTQTHA